MLRFLTAGESHGQGLIGILEGLPAGLVIDQAAINLELSRRQKGYGRGLRMKIEKDKAQVLSGLRKGQTIGSPLTILIKNKDYKINSLPEIVCPRPGHADLAGALKYETQDIRNILERASARETAMRVAIGALAKALLRVFKIEIASHVLSIGEVIAQTNNLSFKQIRQKTAKSRLNCADQAAEKKMIAAIDRVKKQGDSLGGTFEVIALNLPPGLGSFMQWDRRLDAQLAGSLVSIPAIKAVEIGAGLAAAASTGAHVHDPIFYTAEQGYFRTTNRAGGLEGGMTNGQPLVLRAAMKPIATLSRPLASVNIKTKRRQQASVERADVCALPAAGVVAEAMVAFCLARALLDKFGADALIQTKRNYQDYLRRIKGRR
ncbi:chorismate synthase [Candidatus Omnitrophota bacterium]